MAKRNKRRLNEDTVVDLLNQMGNTNVKHSEEDFGTYAVFDLFGTIDGNRCIAEVKQRKKNWKFPYIEVAKAKEMFNFGKENNVEHYYLINSIEETGEHLVYNLKHLWKDGKRVIREMNQRTDFASAGKVKKEVIEFDRELYLIDLSTGALGYKYELGSGE